MNRIPFPMESATRKPITYVLYNNTFVQIINHTSQVKPIVWGSLSYYLFDKLQSASNSHDKDPR